MRTHLSREQLTSRRQQRAARNVATGRDSHPYATTAESCTCADWVSRCKGLGIRCKHQEELALSEDLIVRTAVQAAVPTRLTNAELRARGASAVLLLRGDGDDSLV